MKLLTNVRVNTLSKKITVGLVNSLTDINYWLDTGELIIKKQGAALDQHAHNM